MEAQTIVRVFGYSTAGIVFAAGMVFMLGLIPFTVSTNFRLLFGGLLILYGLYRVWMLWMKRPTVKDEPDETI